MALEIGNFAKIYSRYLVNLIDESLSGTLCGCDTEWVIVNDMYIFVILLIITNYLIIFLFLGISVAIILLLALTQECLTQEGKSKYIRYSFCQIIISMWHFLEF